MKAITTASAPRIIREALRSSIATAAIVASAASPVLAARVVHLRGIVLGTTPEALDIGVPSGDDVHLDMARDPSVTIAEPAATQALRNGLHVSIVCESSEAGARPRGIVVFGNDVHFMRDGGYAWDAPGGASITTGHIIRTDRAHGRLSIVIAYAGATRRVNVQAGTPVITLRPGSREALLNPHAIFVFATPPTDGISLVLQSAIVGDGELQLPL